MKKTISGIRGIVGDDLSVADVMEFCSNFCMLGNSKCVIARDTRPSGAMLKEAACAAMLQNGTDVMDLGIAPTPVVFWEARRCGAGVIVTSSHNPLEWNGLKFIVKGRGINSEQLRVVDTKQNMSKVKHGSEFPLDSLYVDNAAKTIASRCENEVVVDIGGGAAVGTAPELLKKLGCTVHTINENPSNTGRGPDPTVDPLTQLVDASSKHGLGFAFDLDGDRMVLVVDGKKQSPDATLALGVAKALDLGIKKFTLSIDTSIAVEKIILKGGGELTRSRVGEANVVEEMHRTGARAGLAREAALIVCTVPSFFSSSGGAYAAPPPMSTTTSFSHLLAIVFAALSTYRESSGNSEPCFTFDMFCFVSTTRSCSEFIPRPFTMNLRPFHSSGLCDDVTMTPAPHLLASQKTTGVGAIPKSITSVPFCNMAAHAASFSIAPLGLVSRAITHFELPSIQKLLQNSITSATERSSPTMPRIPEMVFFIRFYPQRFFINSNRLLLRLGSSVR